VPLPPIRFFDRRANVVNGERQTLLDSWPVALSVETLLDPFASCLELPQWKCHGRLRRLTRNEGVFG
jgi:hypothetical protein